MDHSCSQRAPPPHLLIWSNLSWAGLGQHLTLSQPVTLTQPTIQLQSVREAVQPPQSHEIQHLHFQLGSLSNKKGTGGGGGVFGGHCGSKYCMCKYICIWSWSDGPGWVLKDAQGGAEAVYHTLRSPSCSGFRWDGEGGGGISDTHTHAHTADFHMIHDMTLFLEGSTKRIK